ncbi:hypothetical protein [Steroidobacter agaridevorans]|nr:hypothetical protein [Steroidobacter agaridevorans]
MRYLGRSGALLLALLSGLLVSGVIETARAAGFDQRYSVRIGDENSDGTMDAIFVKAPGSVLIPIDDLSIVVPPGVRDFILRSNGQLGFAIDGQLSAAERAATATWAATEAIDLFVRDVDLDGRIDLELTGISQVIPNHFDQIVYAPATNYGAPSVLTSENRKFSRFHEDLFRWLQNNDYFDQNAPRKITSVEPAQRYWFGSLADRDNAYLMNKWLQDCSVRYPNHFCAVSDRPPPPPCVRTVSQTDDYGNYIGTANTDICQKPVHILIYLPGAITTAADYSVFDAEARETADILERLNLTCPALPTSDAERLAQIGDLIYQHVILRNVPAADRLNSWTHEPFPGDELFNAADKTYHHYDVLTKVCDLSETNCNLANVRDSAARRYSYPAFQMQANLTTIPGGSLPVYVASPGLTSYPWAYIVPAGPINQRMIQAGPWQGGTQNVTEAPHISYPGTISRYIEQKNNALHVFTHGTGLNRAKCTLGTENRAYNIFLAAQNDLHGPKAFKTLDKQIIRYWRRTYTPNGVGDPPWSGDGNPVDIPAPHQ